jgi:hypothetical protein
MRIETTQQVAPAGSNGDRRFPVRPMEARGLR